LLARMRFIQLAETRVGKPPERRPPVHGSLEVDEPAGGLNRSELPGKTRRCSRPPRLGSVR
jgi:hypothetical protein